MLQQPLALSSMQAQCTAVCMHPASQKSTPGGKLTLAGKCRGSIYLVSSGDKLTQFCRLIRKLCPPLAKARDSQLVRDRNPCVPACREAKEYPSSEEEMASDQDMRLLADDHPLRRQAGSSQPGSELPVPKAKRRCV